MDFEDQIILECKKGNLEKFGFLYDSYGRKIYDFIFWRTLHKETAQDLTSQTFFKALQSIKNFDPQKGQFSSWLYQIAKNNVIDHYRARRFEIDVETVWDLSTDENFQISAANNEIIENVKKYLSFLKPEHRQIVMMRVWDGLSYKEIAQIMGKSEDSCKMMFSRVMVKLREKNVLAGMMLILFITLKRFPPF